MLYCYNNDFVGVSARRVPTKYSELCQQKPCQSGLFWFSVDTKLVMSSSVSPHSRGSSLCGGPSILGMIRARKMAVKIKKRAQFLVADKRRRDNTGTAATVHRDFPKNQFRPEDDRLNVGSSLTPGSRPPSVYSRHGGYSQIQTIPKNTYRMQPTNRFSERKVKEIIDQVLQENLNGRTYEMLFCKEMSKKLSETIKQRVKYLGFSRYKYICIVYIGQTKSQGMRIGSRCLWDDKVDSVAESYFRNGDLFAVATVYALYCE